MLGSSWIAEFDLIESDTLADLNVYDPLIFIFGRLNFGLTLDKFEDVVTAGFGFLVGRVQSLNLHHSKHAEKEALVARDNISDSGNATVARVLNLILDKEEADAPTEARETNHDSVKASSYDTINDG